jgi:hypothetical protein
MLNELDPSKSRSMPWRVEEAYAAELELERARWKAISAFVELLSEDERLAPGYYLDPDWSVKDLVATSGPGCTRRVRSWSTSQPVHMCRMRSTSRA